MPEFPDWINTLKKLHLKRKGNRPKVAPQKFYPSQVELQTQELIREELGEYGYRLADAANKGGVQAVYDVPGAVPQGFDEKVRNVAEAVSLFQVRAFANFSELTVGERYFPGGNEQRDIILNTWSDNFVNLCKSTNEDMRKKVAGVVSDGVLGGRNIRDLTKDIQNTCSDFTRNKAELIATTEVGKLNTAIARNQSESAGIQFYEWSAAMDGRTRESHAVMDGKICKWGDDTHYYVWETQTNGKRKLVRKDRPKNAYMGAPGTDFRCRCTALPYVPEYEDDYEAEREHGEQRGVVQSISPEKVEANEKNPWEMNVRGAANIENYQGLFEGKRSMMYAGENDVPEESRVEFRLDREKERLNYLADVMKNYDFVAKRPFDEKLQKDFNIYAKKEGSRKINAYMRATASKKSAVRLIPEYEKAIRRMVDYIRKTPLQRNVTLFRNMTIDKNFVDTWIAKGYVDDNAFSSFSSSEIHSGAFLRKSEENKVNVKIVYHAKTGENMVAPPYRVLNGKFIGYSEECEYTGRPGEFRIKKWQKRKNLYIFDVSAR